MPEQREPDPYRPGTKVSFESAPRMRLLRHDTPIEADLREAAGIDVWTRYVVRCPPSEGGQHDRVAGVWMGPGHAWRPIRPSMIWTRPQVSELAGDLTVVSFALRGDETVEELQQIALAAGGSIA